MLTIRIEPHLYPMFGPAEGVTFYLLTTRDLAPQFELDCSGEYRNCEILLSDSAPSFEELISNFVTEPAHILVITPESLFESPNPSTIGPHRKLAVMACGSTPTCIEAIEHFLQVIKNSDVEWMNNRANQIFEIIDDSDHLEIVDSTIGTRAVFRHTHDSYEWFEQLGDLNWGGQQLVPAGELSVLPMFHGQYDPNRHLDVNGTIALRGHPIVHSGRPSRLSSDQARIHSRLATILHSPVVCEVEQGAITYVHQTSAESRSAARMFESLFDVDSRYRTIWEIGLGINAFHQLYDGNVAMNEVHGGRDGSIHWGLGLTPWTQYHMDIVCPDTRIVTSDGRHVLGPKEDQET